jgi:hypothetical protein
MSRSKEPEAILNEDLVADKKKAIKLIPGREDSDCAISCLATYLGETYENVLREVARVAPDNDDTSGLSTHEIKKVAAALGHPLKWRKKVNLNYDIGILEVEEHVCVLWKGVVFDPDGHLWDVHDYLEAYRFHPVGIFTFKDV